MPRTIGTHDAALREGIVQAAADLLASVGDVGRVRVADVCAAAGCTPPSLYHHFGSKAGLLRAAAHRLHDDLAARLDQATAEATDVAGRVAARGLTYLRFGLAHPGVYRVLFDSPASAAPHAVGGSGEPGGPAGPTPGRAVQELATDLQALVGASAPAASALAVGLWGTVHGLTLLGIANPEVPQAALEDALLAVVAALGRVDPATPVG